MVYELYLPESIKAAGCEVLKYFFIDESGDAAFYAKGKKLLIGQEGFQPLILLGLIAVEDKKVEVLKI
jgi:hypothetical protein